MANKVSKPNPDLKSLDKLIGTWQLSGDTEGVVKYEWLEGGFFLMQHADFQLFGHRVKAVEIIGHLQPFGESPSADIRSRIYDSVGNTFDYVYEIKDNILTIWGGEKGSPAFFKGKFSKDGNSNEGEWAYPNGGYKSTMTRVN